MGFLKNKHLILAMFVAPLLAVIAYFAVDQVVSEKPHAALDGESYQLIAKSNCRYKSGLCTLENGDIEVKLRVEIIENSRAEVFLSSEFPVQNALITFVDDSDYETISHESISDESINHEPKLMVASAEHSDTWTTVFDSVPTEKSTMRLALKISDTLYYAETTAIFIEYETSFTRGNFSKENFSNETFSR